MESWLDSFERIDLDLTGVNAPEVGHPYDERSHPKILLHTTEGSSLEGAERAFASYPPHVGVEYGRRLKHQYLPLNRCSFALRGAESDDEFIIQVEIVGFAADPPSGAEADWLGREVVAPIAQAVGCPLRAIHHGFHGPNSGFVLASTRSPIRLTSGELRRFSGILGHQHAPPPDTHWDPGAIDIDRILTAARGASPSSATSPQHSGDDPMALPVIVRLDDKPEWWLYDGKFRKHVLHMDEANLLVFLGLASPLNDNGQAHHLTGKQAQAVRSAEIIREEASGRIDVDLDPEAIASAVVDALPSDLAHEVVAKIGAKLSD